MLEVARTAVAGDADVIVVVSRDADFKPAVEAANAEGLVTVALAPGAYGRSDALRNAASEHATLGE